MLQASVVIDTVDLQDYGAIPLTKRVRAQQQKQPVPACSDDDEDNGLLTQVRHSSALMIRAAVVYTQDHSRLLA